MLLFGFCLINVELSSSHAYRSLKQTAGSTSCPWTTFLFDDYQLAKLIMRPGCERKNHEYKYIKRDGPFLCPVEKASHKKLQLHCREGVLILNFKESSLQEISVFKEMFLITYNESYSD